MKYGPQTEEIEALIEKISNMPEKQAVELRDARFAVRFVVRRAALDVAWDAVRDAAREGAWFVACAIPHGAPASATAAASPRLFSIGTLTRGRTTHARCMGCSAVCTYLSHSG